MCVDISLRLVAGLVGRAGMREASAGVLVRMYMRVSSEGG